MSPSSNCFGLLLLVFYVLEALLVTQPSEGNVERSGLDLLAAAISNYGWLTSSYGWLAS